MTNVLAIYGAGGCGRGVIPVARENMLDICSQRLLFVDDDLAGQSINGYSVISFAELCKFEAAKVAIAIADPSARRIVANQCMKENVNFFQIRAAQSIFMDNVTMGEGAIISPFVTITSNIIIGKHFHANLYSYVEHDCTIGDYVTFGPRAGCNGNVVIEDEVYVGAGAVIKQGTRGVPLVIGRGAVIGMGAVVTKSVAAGQTVIGNPARPISQ